MARPRSTVEKAMRAALTPQAKLLLAVSGGMDSSVMLHACSALASRRRLVVEVAHIDHQLRPQSADDARVVGQVAAGYGLPFHLHRLDPPPAKANIEAWARHERYAFLREVRRERGLDWILTAHTADDAAETLLMKLIANKEAGSIMKTDLRRRCLRPLLGVTRREIARYADQHQVQYVHDETNDDHSYLRNRVRHRVLPLLRADFDPRIEEVLAARAEALAEDNDYLYQLVAAALSEASQCEALSREWLRTVRRLLDGLPETLRWRFAEQLVKPFLGYNLGRARGRLLAEFFAGRRGAVVLPEGKRLSRKGGGVKLD